MLFCRILSLLQGSFANETYDFKEPTCMFAYRAETSTYLCVCVCIYIYIYIYIYIDVCVCMDVYMHACIYIRK